MSVSPERGSEPPPRLAFPGPDHELSPDALDTLLDYLERTRAHSGFNSENTKRLYTLLELCQGPERARQAVRTLAMLVHLHYSENDEIELRERSQEGARLARPTGG